MHIQIQRPQKMEGVNMNKATFQAYIFQLLFSAGIASLLPFLSLYLRYLGLTASQVGLVLGTKAAVSMIWAPCWTRCSTRFHKKRFVLMFSVFVLLGTFLLMTLIPPANQAVSNIRFCPREYGNTSLAQKMENLTDTILSDIYQQNSENNSSEASSKSSTPEPVKIPTVPPGLNMAVTSETSEAMLTESERSGPLESNALDDIDDETKKLLAKYGFRDDDLKHLTKKELVNLISDEIVKLKGNDETRELLASTYGIPAEYLKHLTKEQIEDFLNAEFNDENNGRNKRDTRGWKWKTKTNKYFDKHPKDLNQAPNESNDKNQDTEGLQTGEDDENQDTVGLQTGEDDETESPDIADTEFEYTSISTTSTTTLPTISGATEPAAAPQPTNNSKSFLKGNIYDSIAEVLNRVHELPGQINMIINEKVFAAVLCLVIVGEMFSAPAEKLADDVWFEFLDSTDALEKYGSHRMWACLGFALMPPVVTAIIDHTPCELFQFAGHHVHHILLHFVAFGILIGLAFFLSFCYPIFMSSDGKKVLQRRSRFCRGLKMLFNDIHASLYTVSTLMLGLFQGCLNTILFWQIQDKGGAELIMGLSLTAAFGGEFLMIGLQRWMVMKLTYPVAVTMGMFLLGARFVLYSFLWSPWLVLVGEGFHCFSATLIWASVRNYPDFRLNPLVMDRSANSVLNALYLGFGVAPGCVITGYVYDWVGADILFQAAAVTAAVWCVMFAVIHRCAKKPQKVRYAKLLQEDEETLSDGSMEYDDDWLEVAMKHQH